ncbi:MAG: hypothetical protein ABI867_14550 [Kofleriaceae bacterium]
MTGFASLLCLGLVACSSSSTSEWRTFYGIEYRTSKASSSSIVDSVLPGPGGLGGSPVGERPVVTISEAGPHGFYVTITKSSYAMTLDAAKATLLSNKIGEQLVGKTTPTGFELAGVQTSPGGPSTPFHEIYVDLAGGHYDCLYADANCADPAAAEALCRSMRVAD